MVVFNSKPKFSTAVCQNGIISLVQCVYQDKKTIANNIDATVHANLFFGLLLINQCLKDYVLKIKRTFSKNVKFAIA